MEGWAGSHCAPLTPAAPAAQNPRSGDDEDASARSLAAAKGGDKARAGRATAGATCASSEPASAPCGRSRGGTEVVAFAAGRSALARRASARRGAKDAGGDKVGARRAIAARGGATGSGFDIGSVPTPRGSVGIDGVNNRTGSIAARPTARLAQGRSGRTSRRDDMDGSGGVGRAPEIREASSASICRAVATRPLARILSERARSCAVERSRALISGGSDIARMQRGAGLQRSAADRRSLVPEESGGLIEPCSVAFVG